MVKAFPRETVKVATEHANRRVDVYLNGKYPEISRNVFQRLISEERVTVNGITVSKSYRIKAGDVIEFEIMISAESSLIPQDLPIKIMYQDEYLAVISKPAGMVIHPAAGHNDGTLVNALLYHLKDLNFISGSNRPGIVHRLDKDTSGLLVIGKNENSTTRLINMMKSRAFIKKYAALVKGHFMVNFGEISMNIGRSHTDRKRMAVSVSGREALTEYSVMARFKNYDLIRITIISGRTHQIRVHLSFTGHPVVGDNVYGGIDENTRRFGLNRQFLHSSYIGFTHPFTGEHIEVWDDLSRELNDFLYKACNFELKDIKAIFRE